MAKCPDCNDTGYVTLLTSRERCKCQTISDFNAFDLPVPDLAKLAGQWWGKLCFETELVGKPEEITVTLHGIIVEEITDSFFKVKYQFDDGREEDGTMSFEVDNGSL